MFAEFDADGDGALTVPELHELTSLLGLVRASLQLTPGAPLAHILFHRAGLDLQRYNDVFGAHNEAQSRRRCA